MISQQCPSSTRFLLRAVGTETVERNLQCSKIRSLKGRRLASLSSGSSVFHITYMLCRARGLINGYSDYSFFLLSSISSLPPKSPVFADRQTLVKAWKRFSSLDRAKRCLYSIFFQKVVMYHITCYYNTTSDHPPSDK